MDDKIQGRCNTVRRSVRAIHILVVDDDSTCLAVVAGMLKAYKYDVLAVKNPRDALATLRTKQGLIDLVVTDVHMPEMDGFQFQKRVYKEFNLPVIMISSNDDEDVLVKGLEEGAAFFIVKPLSANDAKNIWQHTIKGKKNKANNVVVQKIRTSSLNISPFAPDKPDYVDVDSISTSGDEQDEVGNHTRKKYKRKSLMNNHDEISDDCVRKKKSERKPKVVWSTSLHNRFLYAISQIGLQKSVPKKILEFMNVPGLTRKNVASHLQKYRIFIRKFSNITDEVSTNTAVDRLLLNRPIFISNSSTSLLYDSYQKMYSNFIEHEQQKKRVRHLGVGLGSKNNLLFSQSTNNITGNPQQSSLDTIQLPLKPQNQSYKSDLFSSSIFGLNRVNYVPMIEIFSSGSSNISGVSNNAILNAKGTALSYNYQNGLICSQKKTSSIESTGSIDAVQPDVNNLTYLTLL